MTRVLATFFQDKITGKFDDIGLYYNELSKDYKKKDFKALGGLPLGQKLKITYKGKSAIATKAGVGAGGPKHPKIELNSYLAKKLDFITCFDYVTIEKI